MNVPSLDLCRELYELSGWWTDGYYMGDPLVWATDKMSDGKAKHLVVWNDTWKAGGDYRLVAPAYDLGYLLRKLPARIEGGYKDHGYDFFIHKHDEKTYSAGYEYDSSHTGLVWPDVDVKEADTPEDAAAKLAIELFKSGVLKR